MPRICFDIQLDKKLLKRASIDFQGRTFEFLTYPDVFAYEKIDEGSALLLSKLQIEENDSVADLGCGAGVLGICAATLTKEKVTLLDIDPRAVALAKMNISNLKSQNSNVIGSDLFEAVGDERFDVILTNIPSHLTKEGEERFINSIADHLNKDGTLWIVFQRRIKELIKRQVKELFSDHKVVAMSKKYIVMKVKK